MATDPVAIPFMVFVLVTNSNKRYCLPSPHATIVAHQLFFCPIVVLLHYLFYICTSYIYINVNTKQ